MSGPLETARAAWGPDVPDWIEVLATECAKSSQNKVAVKIDRSAGLVSAVLHKKYVGDMRSVEDAVRGIFMAETLLCSALGAIGLNDCQNWRKKAHRFSPHNSLRVLMFKACARCPKERGGSVMTPSKSLILAMAKAGFAPREIDPSENRDHAYGVLREARRRGEDIPKFTGGGTGRPAGWKMLGLEPEVIVRLTPGAQARGVSVKQMIADLLDVIAAENLVDAILDDGEAGND